MEGKYLSISTAHVDPDTYFSIEAMVEDGYLPAFKKEDYGYFIWVFPKELMPEVPKDLEIVFDYAREHNCDLLVLDGDADVIEDLPTYSIRWDDSEGWS